FDPLLEVQVDFFTVLSVETCRIYSLPSIEVLVAVELAGGAPQRAGRNAGPIAADVIHPGFIETHVSIAVGSHVIRERCRASAEEADLVRTGLVEIIEQPEVGSDTVGIGRNPLRRSPNSRASALLLHQLPPCRNFRLLLRLADL